MNKHDRISDFVESLGEPDAPHRHPCYAGYFTCFNREEYYEAHDVLEHLWLETTDANHLFFKGLIQIAGAFVHLQKQHARPSHPKDGRRLHPASRLFALGSRNIASYGPVHMDLDVAAMVTLCAEWRGRIEESEFRVNPWQPGCGPRITLRDPVGGTPSREPRRD